MHLDECLAQNDFDEWICIIKNDVTSQCCCLNKNFGSNTCGYFRNPILDMGYGLLSRKKINRRIVSWEVFENCMESNNSDLCCIVEKKNKNLTYCGCLSFNNLRFNSFATFLTNSTWSPHLYSFETILQEKFFMIVFICFLFFLLLFMNIFLMTKIFNLRKKHRQ